MEADFVWVHLFLRPTQKNRSLINTISSTALFYLGRQGFNNNTKIKIFYVTRLCWPIQNYLWFIFSKAAHSKPSKYSVTFNFYPREKDNLFKKIPPLLQSDSFPGVPSFACVVSWVSQSWMDCLICSRNSLNISSFLTFLLLFLWSLLWCVCVSCIFLLSFLR